MAAIYRINYKSDFLLTLYCDAGWATPFCLKFWTGAPSKAYFAGYDGEHYTHCAPDAEDPLKLVVQFDDHHLPVGDLKFQVSYHFAVEDFPHDTEDEVLNAANITTEIDGEQAQVMLDFNGETAPEIQFALPAYAAEAQRIANEEQRIANEQQRIDNEQTRINQESARVNEYAELKADAVAATGAANDAAALANQKAGLAGDAATLATQKAGLADDAATLATQKAGLADDAATLATQKAGLADDAATLATQKAGLADDAATLATQKAQYAQDEGDYAKAQGDYAKSQADLIPADVMRTASDAAFVNANREALFYMRQADELLAGLMTSAEHNKLAALPADADLETGIVYDVSALHPTSGVSGGSTYASLSAALAVIPQAKRKGGMTVKFVQSSDNTYVQYRLMADEFSTTESSWQGVDDVPTKESHNLLESGGAKTALDAKANKDGYYESMGVGTANNLAGQEERTNNSMFRTSGGTEDIATGIARITAIKGQTIAWNQILANGNFESTTGWLGITSLSEGVATSYKAGTGSNHYQEIARSVALSVTVGHVYLLAASMVSNNANTAIRIQVTNTASVGGSASRYRPTWEWVGYIWTASVASILPRVRGTNSAGTDIDFSTKEYCIYDLTLIFGMGNEPTTVAEFEVWYQRMFGKSLTYEAYNNGSLINAQLAGIKTVGFNAFDLQAGLVRQIVGNQYEIVGTHTDAYESDSATPYTFATADLDTALVAGTYYIWNNTKYVCNRSVPLFDAQSAYNVGDYVLYDSSLFKALVAHAAGEPFAGPNWEDRSSNIVTDGIFAPISLTTTSGKYTASKDYLHVEGGNTTTCVHLVWAGTKDGTYEPYEEETKPIPTTTLTGKVNGEGESVVVFPDGMKSANSVHDEIVSVGGVVKAIKRVGVVDLGKQTWYASSGLYYAGLAITPVRSTWNGVCAIYPVANSGDKTMRFYGGTPGSYSFSRISIRDSAYETAAALKASLNGVMANVELATPIEYVLDDFSLPVRYMVNDWGTEEQLQASGVRGIAAILTCMYGINAVDLLRNLPKNYISEQSMDNFLAQLNVVTNGTWAKSWNITTEEWDFSFTPNS